MSTAAKGTTPTFELTLDGVDLTAEDVKNVYVTFSHYKGTLTKTGDEISITVDKDDGDPDAIPSTVISVFLDQEETLPFCNPVKIQANWTYKDGIRASTDIAEYTFSGQLLDEVVN